MSNMANATQGIYAPLPQSISDSDSEKELQIDNVRTKSVNGLHKNFERPSANGYMVPNHLMGNPKIKHGFKSMSLARKYCFLFSILACFLTIGIFLWVLPCSEYNTCPIHMSNWENQYDGIELKGQINIVNSAFANSYNLALLFKRNLNEPGSKNGAISILGKNGGMAWYIPQIKEPKDLNCYLIDVNADGVKDCLLLGEMGLEAVDPVSGQILYHVHNQNTGNKGISSIDIPVIIPDLNKDGINEMITTINGKSFHNKLVIVCGKTGLLLSKILLKQCLEVHGLKYENNRFLYSCKNATTTKYFEMPYVDIENRYYNKSFDINSTPTNLSDANNAEYKINDHTLVINNTGVCPDCQSSMVLLNKKNESLCSFSHVNSYTMKPVIFNFKPTKQNILSLKGHVSGYILKLWQWSSDKIWKKESDLDEDYLPDIDKTVNTNIISERTILVTYNDSHVVVVNASMFEVTQLCFLINGEYSCQPDLKNQEESLSIGDLDNDKSQDIISYSSTFVLQDGLWRLVSTMKVIRLEAELPKLFDTPSKLYDVLF